MTEAARHRAAAIGRIPSGLFIVTAGRDETATAMLASWIQQCAFHPPSITVALKPDRPIVPLLSIGTPFVVNILDESQTDLVSLFGRGSRSGEQLLATIELEPHPEGVPVLAEALAYLDCRVTASYPVGDHQLFVGEVIAGRARGVRPPLVHLRKSGAHY